MKKLIMMLVLSTSIFAGDYVYITIGSDAVSTSQKSIQSFDVVNSTDEVSVVRVHKDQVLNVSSLMHDKFNRCGGFIFHDTKEEAQAALEKNAFRNTTKSMAFFNYTITKSATVTKMVDEVKEAQIRETIQKMSTFHNRYYQADTGVDSQVWLKSKWEDLTSARSDVSVELFEHSKWKQPSVILTIQGTTKANDIVILGGHADSIAGFWSKERARAPGADDNASGIATLTEVIRVVMDSNYKPQRTVKIMAYAAEEVGLRGSKEIAQSFARDKKHVVGVVQFDMTNHNGTDDMDIVFMTDYTNKAQTEFMGKLIDTYVKVPWGYSKCGYGCSDHASWHNEGFPASMPFESTMGDINGHIHSKDDTIEQSGGHAEHALKFAKLGVSFLVEMGK